MKSRPTGPGWARIKEVFVGALEREPAERRAFLDAECGCDSGVRREVESLLASHEEAADFIEKPPRAIQPLVETETVPPPFAPGKRIGAYRLIQELGQGGMGSVYLAMRADKEFEKRVAIKLIRPGRVSDFVVQRFRCERQILARLEHSNIARLIDGGTDEGLPYFVMEYVEGVPITEYANGVATPRAKMEPFLKTCAAVEYAHERQIIHRDLKPTNVLIEKDGNPKLLDFGIAKMLNAEAGRSVKTTSIGVRMLTPFYASPEQLRGEASTQASDIYSLGILLHEILTGMRPDPPGTASPQLPAAMREIIARATQEQPNERYVSVEAFAADLRAWVAEQSLAADPVRLAVLPFWAMDASDDTEGVLGLALADAIITQLSNNSRLRVRSTASVKTRSNEADPLAAATELGVDYVLEGHIRKISDRVRVTVQLVGTREKAPVWAAQFEEPSADLLQLEDSLSRQISEATSQQLSGAGVQPIFDKRSVKPAAYQAYLKGRWYFGKYTAESLGKALLSFSQAIAEDPLYALAHAGVADCHMWQAIWGAVPSSEAVWAAMASARKAVELDGSAAEAHASMGSTCWSAEHDAQAAERELKAAVELKPSLGRAHQWLGILHSTHGRHEEGMAALERARETDPYCPWFASFQALCAYHARDYGRALKILEPFAIAGNAVVEEIRAWCLLQMREIDRSKTAAMRAVELSGRSSRALAVLACALYAARDSSEARRVREELGAVRQKEYVSPYCLALVAAAAGENKQAASLLLKGARNGDWWTLWAKTEPRFDGLRESHGFKVAVRALSVHKLGVMPRRVALRVSAALLFVVIAAALVLILLRSSRGTPFEQIRVRKLTTNGLAAHAAISPDGEYVAYALHEATLQSLWLRRVDSPNAVRITQPMDAEIARLSFSGDGSALNFVAAQRNDPADSALLQVPVLGGPIRRLREHVVGPASISGDGQRLAWIEVSTAQHRDELHVSAVDGSSDRILWTRAYPDHFAWPSTPSWSHDGRRILCVIQGSDSEGYYYYPASIDTDARSHKILRERRWQYIEQATWTGDARGALVIGREKDSSFMHIWYLPYSGGHARQLTNDLADYSGLTVTADSKAMVSVQSQTLANVYVMRPGREDKARQVTTGGGRYFDLHWTRQGKLLYATDASGTAEIWTMDADGNGQTAITSGPGRSYAPASSPSGDTIVFHSNRTGSWNIWRMRTDGISPLQLTRGPHDSNWPQVTPDGKWVVYHHTGAEAMWNIFRVPLAGGEPQQLSKKLTMLPTVSPIDGKIACWYSEDAAKPRMKIAIFSPEGGEPLKTIDVAKTVETDSVLRWTPDGKALTFIDYCEGSGNVWIQRIDGGPEQPLTHFKNGMIYSFDWAQDGRLAISQGVSTADVVLLSDVRR